MLFIVKGLLQSISKGTMVLGVSLTLFGLLPDIYVQLDNIQTNISGKQMHGHKRPSLNSKSTLIFIETLSEGSGCCWA